ncbi:MAG: hotdog fold thioesterase [Flavobacteriales bacterium]|nr:hotdog fold thioesterase [Flavobacteriales bacterium]MBP9080436.1 hotdog fold thioesterase [Flavobacteriales bacterium]
MFNAEQLAAANAWCRNTLVEGLGINFIPGAPGTFVATMPVDHRTKQPMGLLHGGATAALAETLGSVGSALLIDRVKQAVVGVELNANHLKGARSGSVTATGTLLHKGRTTHVWDIRVSDDQGTLIAVCRLTNLVIDQRP